MTVNEEFTQSDISNLRKLTESYNSKEIALTPEQQEFIANQLGSKLWRMDNLYKIRDKNAKLITMRMNQAQRSVLTKYQHSRKIILKTRQQGISTLFLAYNLDSCLFIPGYQAGVQSYGQDEADKLSKRAELMWEELSSDIKELMGITLVSNNSKGMTFSNGSVLKIGNFRGDTLQSLHVSELGKIAKRYPEKAKELKTGAFQSVGKGNKITIESTAEGKSGLFYETWQKALLKEKSGKFGPFDFQPIFLSWIYDPDCNIDTPPEIDDELDAYFTKIETDLNVTLTDTQKWWYAAKKDELGDDMKQEYPTTADEAFEQSVEGSYYKNEFKKLKVSTGLYDENLKVHSAFDLGITDTFSIGFFQKHPDGSIKIIAEYQNSGHKLEHYWDIFVYLAETYGWVHGITYVPHDVYKTELIAGMTRWDAMVDLGFDPVLVAYHKIPDGIEATRQFLKEVEIEEKCVGIITAIQSYRKKYDRGLGVYLQSPVHDEHSHQADMLRYMAMGCKYDPIAYSEIYVRVMRKTTKKFSGYCI